MVKVLAFDLDDTLYAEHHYVSSGFRAVSEWIEGNYGTDQFYRLCMNRFKSGQRGDIFNAVLAEMKISYDSEFIRQLVLLYREHDPQITLYDDAKWSLKYFKDRVKLALITDGYFITQQRKVKSLRIASKLDLIVYTDEHGRENWKPSAVPYQKVMDHFGVSGADCMYVGDNAGKDFVTANRLGWGTVHIVRPTGEYRDHVVDQSYYAKCKVESLYELERII